jgi:integrase-like protein
VRARRHRRLQRQGVRAGGRGRAGLPADFKLHELRHTAASVAIRSGANIKALQNMLGPASAGLTLDRYGHLYDSDVDAVGRAIDEAITVTCAHGVGTGRRSAVTCKRLMPLICNNTGGRGRYGTADRWCVNPTGLSTPCRAVSSRLDMPRSAGRSCPLRPRIVGLCLPVLAHSWHNGGFVVRRSVAFAWRTRLSAARPQNPSTCGAKGGLTVEAIERTRTEPRSSQIRPCEKSRLVQG